ncbi:MAG TPA: lactonase family protein [Candidatus Acidoferrum sp.]|nr:lactonase family protein [Candidatus Acidoferrum sp.]
MRPISRRTMLGSSAAALALADPGGRRTFAYTGCYTTAERKARGDGIHAYRVDPEIGDWTHIQHVGALVNPSFLVVSRDGRFLYSVHGDETHASAFSVNAETGQLTLLNTAATGGRNGVSLALDPAGRFLIVANYASGNVGVLPVSPDGRLSDAAHVAPLIGQPGPHRVEQAASHPHQIVFDPSGTFVLAPDKGLDRIFVFAFDAKGGKLVPTEPGWSVARSGSGPRHAAFHPRLPVLWVLNELGNTVVTYQWNAGRLHAVQMLPSLPADYTGENTAAEIAVSADGRFVYCSNRGHDSIAIFAADAATGQLQFVGCVPSRGRSPRFITLDPTGRFLYAANEQSDTIVPFRIDPVKGTLTAVPAISVASPVAIAFATFA